MPGAGRCRRTAGRAGPSPDSAGCRNFPCPRTDGRPGSNPLLNVAHALAALASLGALAHAVPAFRMRSLPSLRSVRSLMRSRSCGRPDAGEYRRDGPPATPLRPGLARAAEQAGAFPHADQAEPGRRGRVLGARVAVVADP